MKRRDEDDVHRHSVDPSKGEQGDLSVVQGAASLDANGGKCQNEMGNMISGVELIPRLRELYGLIDRTYAAAAIQAGFSCRGCDGVACCTVDVTLHTFGEMDYLRQGLDTLDPARRNTVLDRCRLMVEAKRRDCEMGSDAPSCLSPPVSMGQEQNDGSDPIVPYRDCVCALNFEGQCGLYEYRPMICRLAGVPHFFIRPDGTRKQSGGCTRYEREVLSSHPHLLIDRTPFYRTMAQIEVDATTMRGMRTAPRTIAETLATAG